MGTTVQGPGPPWLGKQVWLGRIAKSASAESIRLGAPKSPTSRLSPSFAHAAHPFDPPTLGVIHDVCQRAARPSDPDWADFDTLTRPRSEPAGCTADEAKDRRCLAPKPQPLPSPACRLPPSRGLEGVRVPVEGILARSRSGVWWTLGGTLAATWSAKPPWVITKAAPDPLIPLLIQRASCTRLRRARTRFVRDHPRRG